MAVAQTIPSLATVHPDITKLPKERSAMMLEESKGLLCTEIELEDQQDKVWQPLVTRVGKLFPKKRRQVRRLLRLGHEAAARSACAESIRDDQAAQPLQERTESEKKKAEKQEKVTTMGDEPGKAAEALARASALKKVALLPDPVKIVCGREAWLPLPDPVKLGRGGDGKLKVVEVRFAR
mmetsp:Transcript_107567/g.309620  ORF Transcript_107567/g.309620 Transcript_107567/m.309620 type:complete len:180 (-) Transcript_107567:41-580(-)|eukprot:CAMPEP_0170243516 /NCGR_PEP_ID=MMETSP0116_2-20130129/21534_1 /TAXON_ID=400756 /ORGANISM="Durinskia baltica, Strain CSIRO CS-38" /LENGTH=179 /DNA_ID=CAMNT_0010494371 /DNA_START=43 /DNA_END=582 /DNA_ORIENTATION=+